MESNWRNKLLPSTIDSDGAAMARSTAAAARPTPTGGA
ncbi:hypothetical protein I553_8260 [Mycobacterium xenopi 4042]|uniref:Uncharacterized protein n=1 Tax=Mycobacterium xenopi 4042 TaxID=1299334 RepID=X8BKD0_MYCXE|nr:hypothetical protein I553_8260 [Mycobacterium xenopi 4042]